MYQYCDNDDADCRLAKGMGASIEERQVQGIHGLLPPRYNSIVSYHHLHIVIMSPHVDQDIIISA